MRMSPIRMKPEHPSTALPRSARVHFGRAYAISHAFPVLPLGLIHAGSMETLLSQFEENVARNGESDITSSKDNETNGGIDIEAQVQPADICVAKEIRQQICDVLGPDARMGNFPQPLVEKVDDEQLEGDECVFAGEFGYNILLGGLSDFGDADAGDAWVPLFPQAPPYTL